MDASDFSKLHHIGESLRPKQASGSLTGAVKSPDNAQMAKMTQASSVR